MANTIGWGSGAANNSIGWGKGKTNNAIGWGSVYSSSPGGETDISGTPAGDADANAFIAAAAITDTTQKDAIDKLVVDLKNYGIWTKMKAIYPFIGGTSTQHKYNLRNPLDTDAAFRLVFNGGWTHSSTGALPNGTNSWANSFLNPSTKLTINNTHLSFYSRTQDTSKNGVDMGADSLNANFALTSYYSALSTGLSVQYIYPEHTAIGYSASTRGFFIGSRANITTNKLYRNTAILGTDSTTQSRLLPTSNVGIGANNIAGAPTEYQNHECAFSSIGDGLTDTEAANYYTAVQTFQTTLSRNV